jgi:hypothetical protein
MKIDAAKILAEVKAEAKPKKKISTERKTNK